MEINIRSYESLAECTVSSGGAVIVEDIAYYNATSKCYKAEESFIEGLITAANDLSRFNKITDIDFVHSILEAYVSDSEKEELIQRLTTTLK
jgi:hypothetical protein